VTGADRGVWAGKKGFAQYDPPKPAQRHDL